MSNINKTVVDSRPLNLELLNKAVEAGLLSVLIAPAQIKMFLPTVVVQYATLPADKTPILAENLRRKGIPFCAFDKGLRPTLGSIPAEHLAGQPVVAKVYPKAQPATRPVVKAAGAGAPVVEAKAELPPVEAPAAQNEQPAKKEKKPRAPRGQGKKNAKVKEVNPGEAS